MADDAGPGADPLTGPGGPILVRGVTHDSRRARPGDLYAALPGDHYHGAQFCQQAVSSGAVAVLTDPAGREAARDCGVPVFVVADPRARLGEVASWVYRHPSARLLLIGVTGTSGKTTTTYLLDSGLRRAGHLTGLIGGVETRIAGTAEASKLTTPEATDLQALFATMTERGVTAAAMEVSSHALALGHGHEQGLQVGRFRGGELARLDGTRDPDLHPPDQAGQVPGPAQAGLEQVGGGCLAARAGHPDQQQPGRRVAVDPGRHLPELRPGVGDHEDGQSGPAGRLPARLVGEHGDGAGRRRLLAELRAVVMATGQRRVQVAGLYPARVVGHPQDQLRALGAGERVRAGPGHDHTEQRGEPGQRAPVRAEWTRIRRHGPRLPLITVR